MKGYPKNSALITCAPVRNGRSAESVLVKVLDTMPSVLKRRDIGREYYECSFRTIFSIFQGISAAHVDDIGNDIVEVMEEGNDDIEVDDEANSGEDVEEAYEDDNQVEIEAVSDKVVEVVDTNDEVDGNASGETLENQAIQDDVSTARPLDLHEAIVQFVDDNDEQLHDKTFDTSGLFERFREWSQDKVLTKQASRISTDGFIQKVKTIYRAKLTLVKVNGRFTPGICMPPLRLDMPATIEQNVEEEDEEDEVDVQDYVKEWLGASLEHSDDSIYDHLSVGEIYQKYKDKTLNPNLIPQKHVFKTYAVDWLNMNNWDVLPDESLKTKLRDGTTKNKRSLVRGIKFS
jgi:hypothetical protein